MTITLPMRIAIAIREGLEPGGMPVTIRCRYCGSAGTAEWWTAYTGKLAGYPFFCDLRRNSFHFDHYRPLARGGSHWVENLVLACEHCNEGKRDYYGGPLWEFMVSAGYQSMVDAAKRRFRLEHNIQPLIGPKGAHV
jgi:hypothetical protein